MNESIDLSGLHRELDRLKTQLCQCQHTGECIACRGFELLREQSQSLVAAASQPALVQVAQQASIKDMMERMASLQEKLAMDQDLDAMMEQMFQKIRQDMGDDFDLAQLLRLFGMPPPGDLPPPGTSAD